MASVLRHASRTAGILAAFAVVGTAILVATYLATRDIILREENEAKLELIGQILPQGSYDNDLLQSAAQLPATPELGTLEPTTVYRGTLQGSPAAVVLEAVAPDGYAGRIKMVIAIRANGEIAGVRVVDHHETPGLGDYIDIAKNPWIKVFDGKSLSHPDEKGWKVRKDGGVFEHMTGATISPRAVVKAVHKALKYFSQNRDTIFSLPVSKQSKEG